MKSEISGLLKREIDEFICVPVYVIGGPEYCIDDFLCQYDGENVRITVEVIDES